MAAPNQDLALPARTELLELARERVTAALLASTAVRTVTGSARG